MRDAADLVVNTSTCLPEEAAAPIAAAAPSHTPPSHGSSSDSFPDLAVLSDRQLKALVRELTDTEAAAHPNDESCT